MDLDIFIEQVAQIEDTNLQMKDMKIEEPNVVYKVQNNYEKRFDRRQEKVDKNRQWKKINILILCAIFVDFMNSGDVQCMEKIVDRAGKKPILNQCAETNRKVKEE